MNDHKPKKSIRDGVLGAIDEGKVTMHSKWYFVTRTSMFVVGTVLAILTLLYISSFIFFILHQTGVWFAPQYGSRGIFEFLLALPWLLIGLVVLFVVIVQFMVKRYAFSYSRPLLYSAFGIVIVVFAGGFIIAMTPLHKGLFKQAQMDHLPIAGGLYKQFGIPGERENIVPGEITELVDDGYVLITPRNEKLNVVVNDDTRIDSKNGISVGERVVVIGDRDEGKITAVVVKEDSNNMIVPPNRSNQMKPRLDLQTQ